MRVGGAGGSGTLIGRSLCDLPVFVQCPPADDRVSVRVRVFRPCGVERSLPTQLRRSSCSRHGDVVPEVPSERLGTVLSPAVAVVAFEADELLHDLGREFGS